MDIEFIKNKKQIINIYEIYLEEKIILLKKDLEIEIDEKMELRKLCKINVKEREKFKKSLQKIIFKKDNSNKVKLRKINSLLYKIRKEEEQKIKETILDRIIFKDEIVIKHKIEVVFENWNQILKRVKTNTLLCQLKVIDEEMEGMKSEIFFENICEHFNKKGNNFFNKNVPYNKYEFIKIIEEFFDELGYDLNAEELKNIRMEIKQNNNNNFHHFFKEIFQGTEYDETFFEVLLMDDFVIIEKSNRNRKLVWKYGFFINFYNNIYYSFKNNIYEGLTAPLFMYEDGGNFLGLGIEGKIKVKEINEKKIEKKIYEIEKTIREIKVVKDKKDNFQKKIIDKIKSENKSSLKENFSFFLTNNLKEYNKKLKKEEEILSFKYFKKKKFSNRMISFVFLVSPILMMCYSEKINLSIFLMWFLIINSIYTYEIRKNYKEMFQNINNFREIKRIKKSLLEEKKKDIQKKIPLRKNLFYLIIYSIFIAMLPLLILFLDKLDGKVAVAIIFTIFMFLFTLIIEILVITFLFYPKQDIKIYVLSFSVSIYMLINSLKNVTLIYLSDIEMRLSFDVILSYIPMIEIIIFIIGSYFLWIEKKIDIISEKE